MIRDKSYRSSAGRFLPKEKIYSSLYKFLDNHLPGFPTHLKSVGTDIQKEDDITLQLFFYLDEKTRHKTKIIPYRFANQFAYINKVYSSDLGVLVEKFSRRDPFFVIEAKRLPTPGSTRRKEYVLGKKGGIERFKRKLHGNNLSVSSMIAYITKEDYTYWLKEVNGWIQEQISVGKQTDISWLDEDMLQFRSAHANVNSYTSRNSRGSNDFINLIHYWMVLSN